MYLFILCYLDTVSSAFCKLYEEPHDALQIRLQGFFTYRGGIIRMYISMLAMLSDNLQIQKTLKEH